MREKKFKPMLLPNQEVNTASLSYPYLCSTKLDGIRVLFYKGQILTRSLKQLPNKQLRERFEPIRQFSEEYNITLDGEIYSHELTFQEIISFCMTHDLEDKKSIKKNGKVLTIPEHLKFYCFDYIEEDNFDEPFYKRYVNTIKIDGAFPRLATRVYHKTVNNPREIEEYFDEVLEQGYEGLVLRSMGSKYKCGRATIKENLAYKIKPFRTIDAQIKGIVQATEVDPTAEKKVNELGRSVTSKKKNDRILINKASAFIVDYHGQDLKVTLSMTDEDKTDVWENQSNYIGKWVEYKYLAIGMKDGGLPRHPTTIRMRKDKE